MQLIGQPATQPPLGGLLVSPQIQPRPSVPLYHQWLNQRPRSVELLLVGSTSLNKVLVVQAFAEFLLLYECVKSEKRCNP